MPLDDVNPDGSIKASLHADHFVDANKMMDKLVKSLEECLFLCAVKYGNKDADANKTMDKATTLIAQYNHFVETNKMVIMPDCVRKIPSVNGDRYAFAERENGRAFWCVDSKEEALQLAANLRQVAFLYDQPLIDEREVDNDQS